MNEFEVTLKLTIGDVQILLSGLGKLPMESAIDVWGKVKSQAESQLQAAQAAANEHIEATEPPSGA